jgi:hypothetical protein
MEHFAGLNVVSLAIISKFAFENEKYLTQNF